MANNSVKIYSDYSNAPSVLKEFLYYSQTIKGLSARTVEGYFIDLQLFFRYMIQRRNNCIDNDTIDAVDISGIDLEFISKISKTDILEFLYFVTNVRNNSAASRARKMSSLRGYYKYLTSKTNQLDNNPTDDIEMPAMKKRLPKYLSLEQSIELLNNTQSAFSERDYCIILLFLSCGMRLSELAGIDIKDINNDVLRIIGKGNKERFVYLNNACISAVNDYLDVRNTIVSPASEPALFISKRTKKRMSTRRIEQVVEECLQRSGLSQMGFSTHKLRHTAATLLYRSGNADMLALKEILGHEHVSTTEIYTHISDEAIKKAAKSSPLATFKKPKKQQ
ncbi:MAG: tyrosine recombinase XerC [Ruminococcaceae bacterium]|nr:tyrosine recombinase XerC [Oscillospiraceae bacterium]